MGKIEQSNKTRSKRKNIQQIVLQTILTAGVLSVAAVAPNSLVLIEKLGLPIGARQKESIKRAQKHLLNQGLLKQTSEGMVVTSLGEQVLRRSGNNMLPIKKPRRWDKKWRVLIFDISEKRKHVRDKVRHILDTNGFLRIQDSVWLYPYDCEDSVALLKTDLSVGRDLLYLIVESLENDLSYRNHFHLH